VRRFTVYIWAQDDGDGEGQHDARRQLVHQLRSDDAQCFPQMARCMRQFVLQDLYLPPSMSIEALAETALRVRSLSEGTMRVPVADVHSHP
jgi:hypothetical protein